MREFWYSIIPTVGWKNLWNRFHSSHRSSAQASTGKNTWKDVFIT